MERRWEGFVHKVVILEGGITVLLIFFLQLALFLKLLQWKRSIMLLKRFWWQIVALKSTFSGKNEIQTVSLFFGPWVSRGNLDKKTHLAFPAVVFSYTCLCKSERNGSLSGWDNGLGLPRLLIRPLGGIKCTVAAPSVDRPGCCGEVCPTGGCALLLPAGGDRPAPRGLLCLCSGDRVHEAAKHPTCSWLEKCPPWEPHSEDWGGMRWGLGDRFGHEPQPCSLSVLGQNLLFQSLRVFIKEKESDW